MLRLADRAAAASSDYDRNDFVNLCLALTKDEVQLNLVGWTIKQSSRLQEWLLNGAGSRAVRAHPELRLAVFRRRAANYDQRLTAKRPIWLKAPEEQLDVIAGGNFDVEALSGLLEREFAEPKWEKPAYHLRRSWPRERVVELGGGLAAEVADEVRVLLPFVGTLNTLA